ncbi:hypothetical protein E4U61_001774 [Claviceps capensis]|nr:hypothetical protein E4U61_001774 [Claviceps capensis]
MESRVLTTKIPKGYISMDPNCAICGAPACMGCPCELRSLDAAIRQAEEKVMYFKYADVRKKAAHAIHMQQMAAHNAYHYNSPPLPTQILEAEAELKRAIDLAWHASVQRYPEVLEYFFRSRQQISRGEQLDKKGQVGQRGHLDKRGRLEKEEHLDKRGQLEKTEQLEKEEQLAKEEQPEKEDQLEKEERLEKRGQLEEGEPLDNEHQLDNGQQLDNGPRLDEVELPAVRVAVEAAVVRVISHDDHDADQARHGGNDGDQAIITEKIVDGLLMTSFVLKGTRM